MALFGNVTQDVRGNLKFLGQTTFTQGAIGVGNGGTIYYVDSARSASGKGDLWTTAFITIAEAVAASLAAGGTYDTILVKGTENEEDSGTLTSDYTESVTIAASQIGLRIIGMGNGPEGIAWTVGAQDEVCLTVWARDCYVANMRFRPNGAASSAGIALETNATMTRNPMGFTVENCIFRSTTETALAGILIDSTNDVTIRNCVFTSVITAVLCQATNHSVMYRMRIMDCLVDDKCTNGFVFDGRSCDIVNNSLASDLTVAINTYSVGSAGAKNMVRGHMFAQAVYETGCVGSSSDLWFGNISLDVGSSAVHANGFTNLKIYPQT